MSIRSNTRLRRAPSCTSRARTLVAVFMTLAGTASALAAQGGRRGGGGADQSAPSRPTVAPVLWEPEQIFPLALAHSSDLKLSDEQRAQIETISSKLRASNAPLLISIDTLRPPRLQLPQPGSTSAPTCTRRGARAGAREHSSRARSDDAADDARPAGATRIAGKLRAQQCRARRSRRHRTGSQPHGQWSQQQPETRAGGRPAVVLEIRAG